MYAMRIEIYRACVRPHKFKMSKRRRKQAISVEDLKEEAYKEVDRDTLNESKSSSVLFDLKAIDLSNVRKIDPEIVLSSAIAKFSFAVLNSAYSVFPSLSVLPDDLRQDVMSVVFPIMSPDQLDVLYNCGN
ncbi:hypothetical protein AC249_AIPGENE14872 [Exaiptasia diaphana]|nr:hypothetical protein AC249_AIPGENE14872 [Exaiptasia diaphana]